MHDPKGPFQLDILYNSVIPKVFLVINGLYLSCLFHGLLSKANPAREGTYCGAPNE